METGVRGLAMIISQKMSPCHRPVPINTQVYPGVQSNKLTTISRNMLMFGFTTLLGQGNNDNIVGDNCDNV